MYLDSGIADKKKDYTFIKGILDDAINGFVEKAGPIKKEVVRRGQLIFRHNTPSHASSSWQIVQGTATMPSIICGSLYGINISFCCRVVSRNGAKTLRMHLMQMSAMRSTASSRRSRR
jgi:hypothetical protein